MEFDILDSLDDLGSSIPSVNIIASKQRCNLLEEDRFACLRYCGPLESDGDILEAIDEGPCKSLHFIQLVAWLSKELQLLLDLESCVHALTDIGDSSSFLLEVSSFLKELNCPYKFLLNGPISQRLHDLQSRRTLIDYLCSELQTARLLYSRKKVKNVLEINMDSSPAALLLSCALESLNIHEDWQDHPLWCFQFMEAKICSLLEKDPNSLPPPILNELLSEDQWKSLGNLYGDFLSEYTVRREMLLTRLDVTIQSFKWGEQNQNKEQKILAVFVPRRKQLQTRPSVQLSDVIAARQNLLVIEKTSSAELVKNTKSCLNRILISGVPDRGGRPKEQRPPVEMPNWMKRGRGDHHHGGGSQWRGQGKKFRGNQGGGGRKKGGGFDASGSY